MSAARRFPYSPPSACLPIIHGHASARPNRAPALHSTLQTAFGDIVVGDETKPIGLISRPNHPSSTPLRPATNLIAAIKSP